VRVLQMMECTIGGTRRHLRDLVHGLADRGVDVEVVCSTRREPRMADDVAAMRARGVAVHEVPMVRAVRPGRDLAHALRILAVVLDRGFDVVHTHSSMAGALGRSAAILGWVGVPGIGFEMMNSFQDLYYRDVWTLLYALLLLMLVLDVLSAVLRRWLGRS